MTSGAMLKMEKYCSLQVRLLHVPWMAKSITLTHSIVKVSFIRKIWWMVRSKMYNNSIEL